MKTIITVLLGGIIISSAICNNANAQSNEKGIAFAGIKNTSALAFYVSESNAADKSSTSTKESLKSAKDDLKSSKANLKAMKANFRATENFKRAFKDAPNASWATDEKAIVASFAKDDVTTRVVYDKKGYLLHSLCYYPAYKTPADVRATIERDYPNDDITMAIEVKENEMEFYIVQMENKKTIKQVAVYNGETNTISELRKAN